MLLSLNDLKEFLISEQEGVNAKILTKSDIPMIEEMLTKINHFTNSDDFSSLLEFMKVHRQDSVKRLLAHIIIKHIELDSYADNARDSNPERTFDKTPKDQDAQNTQINRKRRRYNRFKKTRTRTAKALTFSLNLSDIPTKTQNNLNLKAHNKENIRSSQKSIPATDVIGLFNFYLVVSILARSYTAEFTIWGDNMGAIARDVLLFCRRYKLFCKFTNQRHSLKIIIRNNDIFFRAEQEISDLRVAYVFYTILTNSSVKRWTMISRFQINKKQIELPLSSEDVEFILPLEKEMENYVTFDSRVEGVIFRTLRQILPKKWKLMREPSPIILDKTILVPDFGIEKDKKTVYIEIIGFWREEYIKKKLAKLKEALRRNIPMILLIDEKIFIRFSEIDLPKVRYKMGTDNIFLNYRDLIRKVDKLIQKANVLEKLN